MDFFRDYFQLFRWVVLNYVHVLSTSDKKKKKAKKKKHKKFWSYYSKNELRWWNLKFKNVTPKDIQYEQIRYSASWSEIHVILWNPQILKNYSCLYSLPVLVCCSHIFNVFKAFYCLLDFAAYQPLWTNLKHKSVFLSTYLYSFKYLCFQVTTYNYL